MTGSQRRSRGKKAAEQAEPVATGTPASQRELRAQGRRTMGKLLDAGMKVFAERGYHAARVDDIVRAARTSHGTFYLYFTNKEDLLRALAVRCADELDALAEHIGPITADDAGLAEVRAFLAGFLDVYERYGPVIRAWMEGQVSDREVNRLGLRAFMRIGNRLRERMREAGGADRAELDARVGVLMAMLERFNYFYSSRDLGLDREATLDTLARIAHRGFFEAAAA
ncbi:MAG: TetR/AcrR family transcriptional regulator [Acidimicrobiia bacterium]|nr:TetR/AcrR family transcriptional regulator [Acidimicrobiia bacterium]